MTANGKAADDGRVADLAMATDARLVEARGFGATRKWWSGWYYGPHVGALTTSSPNPSQPMQSWVPLWVPHTVTVDRIGMEVTTGLAGPTVTLGIYDSTVGDEPGALILNAGTIDPSTPGFKQITITQTLSRGLHWLSFHATGKLFYRAITGSLYGVPAYAGGAWAAQPHNSLRRYDDPGLINPAPAASTLSGGISSPYIQVRVA